MVSLPTNRPLLSCVEAFYATLSCVEAFYVTLSCVEALYVALIMALGADKTGNYTQGGMRCDVAKLPPYRVLQKSFVHSQIQEVLFVCRLRRGRRVVGRITARHILFCSLRLHTSCYIAGSGGGQTLLRSAPLRAVGRRRNLWRTYNGQVEIRPLLQTGLPSSK